MTQCTAMSKRTGERCKAQAVTGREKCRHHGGKTPAGPASPHWVDGRRSRILPKGLMDDYHAARRAGDTLALVTEIALIDARINDLLVRVDSGESGRLWTQLRTSWRTYDTARRAGDPAGMAQALATHGETLTRGHADWATWDAVVTLVEQRRRLVAMESKRLADARQMIRADEAMAMMGILVETVLQHVHDDDARRAIATEFERLTA
jgi:hypothetical protein